ncbi:MAG: GNAT family N-acetyltransferase [Terriglobales bacterium]
MVTGTESPVLLMLDIESERFGVRVARAPQVTTDNLDEILRCCMTGDIQLLIARCPTGDLAAAQCMEAQGFYLADTLIYYGFDLVKRAIPQDRGGFQVRRFQPEDEPLIEAVAKEAFKGYLGHYHADPRLDRRKCDEAYVSWAKRSCVLKEVAEQVFVAERDNEVAGFATLRLNSREEGEGLLYAVAPHSQGLGICHSLMLCSLQWCSSQGAHRMVISTQVTNIVMQKVWCQIGFEPRHSFYTFHKWFTSPR